MFFTFNILNKPTVYTKYRAFSDYEADRCACVLIHILSEGHNLNPVNYSMLLSLYNFSPFFQMFPKDNLEGRAPTRSTVDLRRFCSPRLGTELRFLCCHHLNVCLPLRYVLYHSAARTSPVLATWCDSLLLVCPIPDATPTSPREKFSSNSVPTHLTKCMSRYSNSTKTIIQFNVNKFFIYSRADLTAQRRITKQARVKKKYKFTYKDINTVIYIIL